MEQREREITNPFPSQSMTVSVAFSDFQLEVLYSPYMYSGTAVYTTAPKTLISLLSVKEVNRR